MNLGEARELVRAEMVRSLPAGFEPVAPGTWVAPLSDQHRAVVALRALKGAQYDLVYGISCAWVPHEQGGALRWHRTARTARLDLWVDHFTPSAPPRRWVGPFAGASGPRRQAARLVGQVASRAPAWWAAVATLEGVLDEARRQTAGDPLHHPSPRYVVAFTLARLGDLAEAERELGAVPDLSPELRVDASRKLRQVAAAG